MGHLKTEDQHSNWAVAEVFTQRLHRVVQGVNGAFVPTYAKVWNSAGKKSSRELPLLYGYVLFPTDGEDWAGVKDVDGVYRVLAANGRAQRVTNGEIVRLTLDHAMGAHNRIEAPPEERKRYSRRRRRPRPGKRVRAASCAVA
jgi:hypothetical protein